MTDIVERLDDLLARGVGFAELLNALASGWVIEGAWSDPAEPQYWCGSSLWSYDHLKALRFAREHDAKQAADAMCAGMNVRICEHVWQEGNHG